MLGSVRFREKSGAWRAMRESKMPVHPLTPPLCTHPTLVPECFLNTSQQRGGRASKNRSEEAERRLLIRSRACVDLGVADNRLFFSPFCPWPSTHAPTTLDRDL